jgi:hypothetical protein
MAHFSKLGKGNIVEKVIVISDNDAPNEQAGIDFINNLYGTNDVWKQTSFNTFAGAHRLGGTPFRKNFGTKGYRYDHAKDAFIAPNNRFPSWVLNETTCHYEPPVAYPTDGQEYDWDETIENWKLRE